MWLPAGRSVRLPRAAALFIAVHFGLSLLILSTAHAAPNGALRGLVFLQPPSKSAGSEQTAEEWQSIYFGRKKIGHSVSRTEPTTYRKAPAIRETGSSLIRLEMLGTKVEEEETSETISDTRRRPLKQTLDVRSNGSALHVEALFDYAARQVRCTVGTGPQATRKTLIIPEGANLAADTNSLTQGQDLKLGKRMTFYYLQPLTVTLSPATLTVRSKARIRTDAGQEISAFVIDGDLAEGKMTSWTDANGRLIRSEVRLGVLTMTMVSGSRTHALDAEYISPALSLSAGASGQPNDFADATAIVPDHPIRNPRKLVALKARIAGIPKRNVLASDDRQSVTALTEAGGDVFAVFSIQAERFKPEEASLWPVTGAEFAPYLSKAAYLDTDDPEIRQTAASLRGDETNLYRIASNIRFWVHKEMTPDAGIGVVRSSADVYSRRRGVCRDYATLYTALARAAGVPTRLCAGIVYAQGKFFYHAWAESWVGRWVAFDPTLFDPSEADYVDATHVKFAQGDVTQMYDVISIVGRLKILILNQSE